MISYLCNISGVSRSGYYRYFSSLSSNLQSDSHIHPLSDSICPLTGWNGSLRPENQNKQSFQK